MVLITDSTCCSRSTGPPLAQPNGYDPEPLPPLARLEPGLGAASSDLGRIAPAVARDSRVRVCDRAGRGWSDAADGPQDAAHIAADLHTLLDRAHVPSPYVLAGRSFGGLYILSFAAQFPDQIAGMVPLDSTAPNPVRPCQPTPSPTTLP
jgi:pimeloyl-ACP methyl ester carboxylesterase